MGLLLINKAEAQASGTVPTVGPPNTGDADSTAFDELLIGSGMALTFDNAHPLTKANAFKIATTTTATTATYLGWTSAVIGAPVRRLYGGFSFWANVVAPSTIRFIQFMNGATTLGYLGIASGGNNLQFRTAADAALQTASTALGASNLMRCYFDVLFDGTSASGRAWAYSTSTGNRLAADGWFGSAAFGTSAGCDHIRIGATTAAFSAVTGDNFSFDDFWISDQPLFGPMPQSPGQVFIPKLWATRAQPRIWTPRPVVIPVPDPVRTVPIEGFTASLISGGLFLNWLGIETTWVAPTLPTAPGANYTIPGGAVSVTNQAQLETELAKFSAEDIVLEDGNYTRSTEYVPGTGHRLWARNPGMAVLNYGLRFNYMSGWEVHGLKFDIPDQAHAATDGGFTAAILGWSGTVGFACNATITDVYVEGNGALGAGIVIGNPHGLKIQRVRAQNFVDWGLYLSNSNTTDTSAIDTLTDIDVRGVYRRTTRGASDGLSEAGLWVGHRVTNGVQRVYVNDCGWSGIWTGNNCNDTAFSDLTVLTVYGTNPGDGKTEGAGIYLEHFTRRCSFKRFDIRDVVEGIDHEWDQGIPGNGASWDVTMRYGYIDTSRASAAPHGGIFLGDGTVRPVIADVRFLGYDHAGIIDNTMGANTPTTKNNTTLILGVNSFEGVVGGTYGLTYMHPNNGAPTDPGFTATQGYNVYRGTAPNVQPYAPAVNGSPLTNSEYSDTVGAGTYYYTAEAVNPYGWRASSQWGPFVATSAIAKALTATITVTAAISKSVAKKLSAPVTSSAVLTKAAQKIMSAPVTATASIKKSVGKLLSAPVTATATVGMIKSKLVSMVANVAASAVVTKTVNKSAQATVTATATVKKVASKALSAPVTATATVAALKVKVQALVANVAASALVTKTVNKTVPAAVTATAAMQRVANKILSAPVTATASIQKAVGKFLSAPVTTTASITKTVAKKVKANVNAIGGMAWVYFPFIGNTYNQGLQAAVTATASMKRTANKTLQSSVTLTATIKRTISTKMTAAVTATGTMLRGAAFFKTLTAPVTVTASIIRARTFGKTLQASVTVTASIARKVKRGLVLTPIGQAVLTLIEAVKRFP